MNNPSRLKDITSKLTVLYVEDEELFRITIERKLKDFFRDIILAKDGVEGLERLKNNPVDLIITDNLMPNLSGLDMIQEIRKQDTKTPIILVTGFIDTEFLIRAINLGVTQFVAKPINYDNLYKAIEIATQRVILENLERKTQEQELELLKYREKYHSLQQERAFRKELNIIKNDLYFKRIILKKQAHEDIARQWHCSVVFKPLDIMSGDSYSIREIQEGRYLFILLDAMGKGLSASVTTILSTSYINHFVTQAKQRGDFSLVECINAYQTFIREELLEDEIVCLSFIEIDFQSNIMRYAMFSEPPLLLLKVNGEIQKVRSNNQPVMKFPLPFKIDEIDLGDVKKMLFYSDGLNECFSSKDKLYEEHIEADFADSYTAKELYSHFSRLMDLATDDITIIFLSLMPSKAIFHKDITINSRIKEVSKAADEVSTTISSYMSEQECIVFMSAMTELLFNAYEHGNIELEAQEKKRLIAEDLYDNYLSRNEDSNNKKIHIVIGVYENGDHRIIEITITDEGRGFDVNSLHECGTNYSQFSGRGVRIAQNILDGIYYNQKGNEVTMIKKIKKEA